MSAKKGVELLVAACILPHAPVDGDRLRLWHWLRLLKERGFRLTLACQVADPAELEPSRTRALRALLAGGLHAVVHPRPRQAVAAFLGVLSGEPANTAAWQNPAFGRLLHRLSQERRFGACLAYRLRSVLPCLELDLPLALDLCDAMSWYALQRQGLAKGPARLLWAWEASALERRERRLAGRLDAAYANGEADARLMAEHLGQAVATLPNGVDFDYHRPARPDRRDADSLVFVGQMGYAPNHEAVLSFYQKAFPLIRRVRPGARLTVVGPGAPKALDALRRDPAVELTGGVPDVRPYVQRARVALCTVQSGAGRQNKLLEAMAMGTPAVASPLAARGLGAEHGRQLLVAQGPEAEAQACLALLARPALGRALASRALAWARKHYDWEGAGKSLAASLAALARQEP